MYNKRLVTSLIEHEVQVLHCQSCVKWSTTTRYLVRWVFVFENSEERKEEGERERENRKGWEKRLFIDGIIRERSGRWPPYPEGGERNTGNQLAEERRHRATRYESESGS